MSTFKGLMIDFINEEAKFTSLENKKKSIDRLLNLPEHMLWNMVLEKARQQGMDQALDIMIHMLENKAPNFDYRNVRKR